MIVKGTASSTKTNNKTSLLNPPQSRKCSTLTDDLFPTPRDIVDSMDIRKKVETGQGLALSVCWSSMGWRGSTACCCGFSEMCSDGARCSGQRNIHGWPGILKGVPNAIFSYEEVLRAIGDLTRPALEESDTDEEKEGTRQSLIRKMGRNKLWSWILPPMVRYLRPNYDPTSSQLN